MLIMKKMLLIVLCLFAISCTKKRKPAQDYQNQNKKYDNQQNQNDTTAYEGDERKPFSISKKINLKPDITIQVNQNHNDGIYSYCNIDLRFASSTSSDNILISDSDPIETFFVADLNNDGIEELYLETKSAGSGGYGDLIAISADESGRMMRINTEAIDEIISNDEKYSGHDYFYLKDKFLVHEYPLYNEEDPNCCPTGGNRMNYYQLSSANNKLFLTRVISQ